MISRFSRETAHRVFAACGFVSGQLHHTSLLGRRVWLLTEVDAAEAARRRAARIPGLTSRPLLALLCTLPADQEVPLDLLSEGDRRLLAALPAGVVEVSDRSVVRRAIPPAQVRGALAVDHDFDRGLDRASAFAGFCARILAYRGEVEPTAIQLADADFYGIGVVRVTTFEVLVTAEPVIPRHGPVSWGLRERAYESLAGVR